MIRIAIYCMVSGLTMLLTQTIRAQTTNKPQPLEIGDHCPDFIFNNLVNHPDEAFSLSSLKGKWVILDFWSRGCKSCVPLLKEAADLEKRFDPRLVIIPVTRDKREVVEAYLEKTKALQGQKIFTVTSDTTLWWYFPRRGVPHEVWINPEGKVAAITDGKSVSAENVGKVLSQGSASFLREKKDILTYDFNKPLLQAGEAPAKHWTSASIATSSTLTRNQPGLPSMGPGPAQIIGEQIKMISTNICINDLYAQAFALRRKPQILENNPDFLLSFRSRTILEVKDSSHYYWPGRHLDNRWRLLRLDSMTFCYELIMPLQDSNRINEHMLQDLNRFFGNSIGIEGLKEKRRVKCWALTRTLSSSIQPSRGGKPIFNLDEDAEIVQVQNSRLSTFLFYWISFHQYLQPIPIIDETGYTGPLDFTLKVDPNDLQAVSKALEPYGFQFQLVERELDMIIIRDKK